MPIQNDLTVWFMDIRSLVPGQIGAMETLLSVMEFRHAERLKTQAPRERYIANHALARLMISRIAKVDPMTLDYVTDRFGKPAMKLSGTDRIFPIGLSRTNGLVAVGHMPGFDFGIDVECKDTTNADRNVARQLFSMPEQTLLDPLTGDEFEEAFFKIWTLKEAYVKAEGRGLSIPLEDFAFDLEPPKIKFIHPDTRKSEDWVFQTAHLTEIHRLAIAVRSFGSSLQLVTRPVTVEEALP